MKTLFVLAMLLSCASALAHPGHDAPPGHGVLDHAWAPLAAAVAILALLAWGALRRRQGVLPLAIAIAVALGAGTAGVGLPL